MLTPLTKRQAQILDHLREHIGKYGYAPSIEEIGAHFGLSSPATVHKHLDNLRRKGRIRRNWNHARSIELVTPDGACPTCGRALDEPSLSSMQIGAKVVGCGQDGTDGVSAPTAPDPRPAD